MNKIKYFFLALLVNFMISCEEDGTGGLLPLYLNDLSPRQVYPGQKIRLFGQGFGEKHDSSYVLFDTLKIPSAECIEWTSASIVFITPETEEGELSVKVMKDSEESNALKVTAAAYPPVEIVEMRPGSFLIGSETGFANERPVREVLITKTFYISKYEISAAQYALITGGDLEEIEDFYLPAAGVSWRQAAEFCNLLSEAEGFEKCYEFHEAREVYWLTERNGWRLPTEAEWEYACRAGTQSDFAGSGLPEDMAWYNSNSGFKPHPSGEKQPNAWGIYDMHGNLWEWCWDFYGDTYYKEIPETDPIGPNSGSRRVIRGGAFDQGEVFCRSSNRTYPPGDDFEKAGIRIVRTKNN